MSAQQVTVQEPTATVERKIARWKQKGDRARRAAHVGTAAIILSSAAIPVMLLVSTESSPFLTGKLAPSILAGIAAGVASWLQFERPYEGWRLYRGYQHLLELEKLQHDHKAGPYRDELAPDRVLVERLAEFQRQLEQEWNAHIPTEAEITGHISRMRAGDNGN